MTDKEFETQEGFFIPKNVDYSASKAMFSDLTPRLYEVLADLRAKGWTFYAVNQTRGRCHYQGKIITIPVWALLRSASYKLWYISHEMSHAVAGAGTNHGPKFMQTLKSICPETAIHHELNYKPKNAKNAGICHYSELDF